MDEADNCVAVVEVGFEVFFGEMRAEEVSFVGVSSAAVGGTKGFPNGDDFFGLAWTALAGVTVTASTNGAVLASSDTDPAFAFFLASNLFNAFALATASVSSTAWVRPDAIPLLPVECGDKMEENDDEEGGLWRMVSVLLMSEMLVVPTVPNGVDWGRRTPES